MTIRGTAIISRNDISNLLTAFIRYTDELATFNTRLTTNSGDASSSVRKIRAPAFPSEISENIVRYLIHDKYHVMPIWNTDHGDLIIPGNSSRNDVRIEVKAFSSDGPTSFGPTEKWDILYFLDCTRYRERQFACYEIKLGSNELLWQSVMVNSKQTMSDQCYQSRRPRVTFAQIYEQLHRYGIINLIFSGTIN